MDPSITLVLGAAISLVSVIVTTGGALLIAHIRERRTDDREQLKFDRETDNRQREILAEVADAFLTELNKVRHHVLKDAAVGGPPLEFVFEDAWLETIEMQLRHGVDRITDASTRQRLRLILDAVNDYQVLAVSPFDFDGYISWLFELGREIAMAAFRGQDADQVTLDDVERLVEWTEAAKTHREAQRVMRTSKSSA
ncbi:hypothetical protein [Microbacterium bovistercoris]|nr:hypothetical protein [Microbacterium bovistercoris]